MRGMNSNIWFIGKPEKGNHILSIGHRRTAFFAHGPDLFAVKPVVKD